MINLLPQKQKDELKQEENFKLTLILGIVTLASLICFALILFSIKISIGGQLSYQKIFLEQKKAESSQLQNLEEKMKSLNSILKELNSFYQNEANLVEAFQIISTSLPSKIYLTTLNFNQVTGPEKEKYLGNIFLTGFVPSREILTAFKKNLEKEKRFEVVYFPPESWVKPTDINFTASFKVK